MCQSGHRGSTATESVNAVISNAHEAICVHVGSEIRTDVSFCLLTRKDVCYTLPRDKITEFVLFC